MSSSIWTRCAGDSEVRALEVDAWRVVEAQHQVSTRKLVDSNAEQQLLEQLIDSVKPPEPAAPQLHYLLFTPFRYPPLRHGSRFGTRDLRGIWYGSLEQVTALAEVAYYRLLFLEGTTADLGAVECELTAFTAIVRTDRAIDLTVAPFDSYRDLLSSPNSYAAAQSLGQDLRAAAVAVVKYFSARATADGINVAVLAPSAFGRRQPREFQNWYSVATREYVEFEKRDYFRRAVHTFPREQFLVGGALPAPAI